MDGQMLTNPTKGTTVYVDYIETPNDNLPLVAIVHSEGERFDDYREAAVAVANEFSDFLDFLNEGAPVNLGNSYAWYEFAALVDGFQYTFGFGPDDMARLNRGECKLYAAPFNELDE